jgi:uncharacterized sulfatase
MHRLASYLLLLACTIGTATAAPAFERPNILFVYTDDQALWTLGASGYRSARTPNMDRLAREGAYFTNAFTTTPVCSPSRAGLLTSRYGSELGVTDWLNPKVDAGMGLDPATVTWSEVLTASGYRSGLVGKWHLGLEERFHPTRTGYPYFFGHLAGSMAVRDPTLEVDGKDVKVPGFTADLLTDRAIEFLRVQKSAPFLLSLHYRAPHAPWLPLQEEDLAPFRDLALEIPNPDYPGLDVAKVEKNLREYLGSVHSVDRNLGRLLAVLDELGLTQRTLVIFTSDHGYNMGHNGIWHKGNGHWIVKEPPPGTDNVPQGQRPNLYDHSLRVPCLVRWPGVVQPGTVIERTVTNLDWYPTLLAAAGAAPPEGVKLRGRSLMPLLRGEKPAWDDDLYVEYSTRHQSRTHMRAYRTPAWKLVRDFLNPGRGELYHLSADPEERRNLIDSKDPEVEKVVRELDAKIFERMRELKDPALTLAEPAQRRRGRTRSGSTSGRSPSPPRPRSGRARTSPARPRP